ncbi:hypothetical protein [Mesorhizobium sp. B2-4-15]|uniref:hypothetical protein n=1 Tax=Mesorhizobium sp. B2-4-15 TaxID=2589934 RepID=UPI0015EE8C7E|nr:hypothetical protein [Mesorhizobium sp. B2-4-15]
MNIRILIAAGSVALASPLVAPANAQEMFYGYNCSDGCSGHQAGYNWAQRNDITDESDCDGNSRSFNEGCQAYIDEQSTEPVQRYQPNDGNDDEDSGE